MDGRTLRRAISKNILAGVVGLAMAGSAWTAASARGDAMSRATLDLPGGAVVPSLATAAGPALEPGRPAARLAAETPRDVTAPVRAPHDAHVAAGTTPVSATTPKVEVATPPKVVADSSTAPKAPEGTAEPSTKPADPPVPALVAPIEHQTIRPKSDEPTGGGDKPAPKSALMSGLYSTLQVGGALAVVLGLILIGRTLMRKMVPGASLGSGKGVMETLARYPIGRNQSVVLLRIGSQIVALNQTKDASQSILVISEPVEVAKIIGQIEGQDPRSIQQSFNRMLSTARQDLESPDPMDVLEANRSMNVSGEEDLDSQLEEMAAAKRQLMELRAQVRSVRDNLPTA